MRLVSWLVFACLSGCGSAEAPASIAEGSGAPADPAVASSEPGTDEVADEAEPPSTPDLHEADASPTEVDTSPHEVVIVAVHEDPLLRSETRVLEVIVERMQMRRIDAIQRDATEAERACALAFFAGEGDSSAGLPPSLAEAGTVVFLRFPANRELGDGQLATRGFGGAIAFRRADREPYLELRVEDEAAWRGPDEQLWPWLVALVRLEASS
jgi:hypothetical protein